MLDLIIIGAGPAGLSAAVYASRAELNFMVIDASMMPGGQILQTYEIDNYLGLLGMGGFEMATKFSEHAKQLGATFVTETVTGIDVAGEVKKITTDKNTYESRAVIIATGASHMKGGVPGEEEFAGRGVSYCATCDGAFFRNKITAVVGGGNVALEDALYLSRLCTKVYLIHRRDEFRGAKATVTKIRQTPNIEVLTDTVVTNIQGEMKVNSIDVKNVKSGKEEHIDVNGVFFAVGMKPVSGFACDQIKTDEAGYIVAGEDCKTSVPGVFVAGDLRTKAFRQVSTAVADGAYAVFSVEKYLQ